MFVSFLENSSFYTKSVNCPREAEKNIMKLMSIKTFHTAPKNHAHFVALRYNATKAA